MRGRAEWWGKPHPTIQIEIDVRTKRGVDRAGHASGDAVIVGLASPECPAEPDLQGFFNLPWPGNRDSDSTPDGERPEHWLWGAPDRTPASRDWSSGACTPAWC